MAFSVALTRCQHYLQITKSHCTSSMILFQTLITKTMIIDHRQKHAHQDHDHHGHDHQDHDHHGHDHQGVAAVRGKARRSTQVQVDLNFPGPQG